MRPEPRPWPQTRPWCEGELSWGWEGGGVGNETRERGGNRSAPQRKGGGWADSATLSPSTPLSARGRCGWLTARAGGLCGCGRRLGRGHAASRLGPRLLTVWAGEGEGRSREARSRTDHIFGWAVCKAFQGAPIVGVMLVFWPIRRRSGVSLRRSMCEKAGVAPQKFVLCGKVNYFRQ